jgi:predicted permease
MQRWWTMLSLGDFKYALRLLLKRPGFTLLTVLVLSGGFGISLYTFGALNTIVYGELPVANSESVVRVGVGQWPNFEPLDAYELAQIREEARGLNGLGAYRTTRVLIGEATSALSARGIEADWGIFDFTGTRPLHGRGFIQQDSVRGAEPVAVLGYDLWQSAFAGDARVIGSFVRIAGTSMRIVGVMPDGYRFPQNAALWLPLSRSVLDPAGPTGEALNAYARVRAGVSVAAVEAELTTILQRVRDDYSSNSRVDDDSALESVSIKSFPEVTFGVFGDVVFGVLNLLALSILLLAAVNVGNLLLARTNRRIREVGVRVALGAPRVRLVAQVVLENLLLCTLGGAVAVWLAARGLSATNGFMRQLLGIDLPFWWIWRLDRDVLLVALSSLALTVAVVSVLPAISVSRADPNLLLREGSHGGGLSMGRISRALVTLQVALISALMLVGSVATAIAQRVASFDIGMDVDDMLMMSVQPSDRTPATGEARLALYERVLENVRAAPEIEAAMILHDAAFLRFSADGAEYPTLEEYPGAWRMLMSAATDVPIGPTLIEGRAFDSRDTTTSLPTAMVSESLAREYWPNASPLGRSIDVSNGEGEMESRVVVGVMSNVTFDAAGITPVGTAAVYIPSTQLVLPTTRIVARYRGDEARAKSAMYQALTRVDPTISPGQIMTYAEAISMITRFGRTITALFAGCGAFAILLAITGIYGMSSNGIVLRRHEIGLRRALGASDGKVLRIFVVQGVRQLVVGLVFSALLSVVALAAVSRGFSLEGPTLALIGGIVVLVVSFTVLLSIYLSVRGVLRLEPGSVLRFA